MLLDHDKICRLGVGWLKRPASRQGPGCQAAFSEARGGWNGEIVDAIGFRAGLHDDCSVVLEAKTSRADFFADLHKPHRQTPALGMGVYRYYIAPLDLLKMTDLPPGWGWIEVLPSGTLIVRCGHVLLRRGDPDIWRHARAIEQEWVLLTRVMGRIGDVDQLHRELKKIRNERDRLAKSCDRYAEQERQRILQAVAGQADPGKARPKSRSIE